MYTQKKKKEEEKKLHVAQPLAIKNKNKQRKKRQKTLAPRFGKVYVVL